MRSCGTRAALPLRQWARPGVCSAARQRSLAQQGAPVSVCHQVSTTGQRPSPTTSWNQRQAAAAGRSGGVWAELCGASAAWGSPAAAPSSEQGPALQEQQRERQRRAPCGSMGSPTVPSSLRLERSCAVTHSSPCCISERSRVGAVYRVRTWGVGGGGGRGAVGSAVLQACTAAAPAGPCMAAAPAGQLQGRQAQLGAAPAPPSPLRALLLQRAAARPVLLDEVPAAARGGVGGRGAEQHLGGTQGRGRGSAAPAAPGALRQSTAEGRRATSTGDRCSPTGKRRSCVAPQDTSACLRACLPACRLLQAASPAAGARRQRTWVAPHSSGPYTR
jgi:hypothetical protein